LADNADRRKIMIFAQIFMLVTSTLLVFLAWQGALSPWALLAFTFAIGCGTALYVPSWQASVGDIVPRRLLAGAVAYNSMGFNLARSLGPAVGGAIIAFAGVAAAFTVNALSYVGLLIVLLSWRLVSEHSRGSRESISTSVRVGFSYIAMSPDIKRVLIRTAIFGFGAVSLPALLPIIALQLAGDSALYYGFLVGMFGAGAVAGAFAMNSLRSRLPTEFFLRMGGLALATGTTGLLLSGHEIVNAMALVLAGSGWLWVLSTLNVTVQFLAPRWVVARTLSYFQMAVFGGMAAGGAVFGAIAETGSVATALTTAVGVLLLWVVIGFIWPVPEIEEHRFDPLDKWSEPDVVYPVEPRSGPVSVSIEYIIPEDRIDDFLFAMVERRRIRLRDGAKQWELYRDLNDLAIWIERYSVPTWRDYVLHNVRRTKADATNSAMLLSLHSGTLPPQLRRLIRRDPRANDGNAFLVTQESLSTPFQKS
ncbi:MAG: MFS transporter, partial [Parasphingorhabdus sp.]